MNELGLIQVYTGTGKGKTTAAIGAGIRAVGQELRVHMIQFLKGGGKFPPLRRGSRTCTDPSIHAGTVRSLSLH